VSLSRVPEILACRQTDLLVERVTRFRLPVNIVGSFLLAGAPWAHPGAVWAQSVPPQMPPSESLPDMEKFSRALEESRVRLFEKAAPAVVILEVEVRPEWVEREVTETENDSGLKQGFPQGEPPPRRILRSEGSGFIVRADGVIVTNRHVVAGARQITVRFRNNQRLAARLAGEDERADIAVLRVEAKDLPVLEFADSDAVRVGQEVYAIGAPFGQEWSFTSGMLSGKNRTRLLGPSSALPLYEDYLQTDAFVNSGHSGGPLLDGRGRVVGMNTLIARADRGLAFAVPANFLKHAVAQILEAGTVQRPWFGFRVETLGETAGLQQRLSAAGFGAVVLSVEPESPAVQSDLRPGDVVQAVDGQRVSSAVELQRELFGRPLGRSVKLTVWRLGAAKTVALVPRPLPMPHARKPEGLSASLEPPPKDAHYGLVVKEIKGVGVRVETVENSSVAARADLQSGDVILEVEGKAVKGVSECFSALALGLKRNQGGALVQIDRHGHRLLLLFSVR
jgi:S1-C subfamily serine protease